MRFVVEISYCLKVEQTVDLACADFIFRIVHFAADTHAPGRDAKGQPHIDAYSDCCDQCIRDTEQVPENAADQNHFEQGRQDVKGNESQQKLNSVGAPVDKPVQCAGLSLKVKAYR